MLIEQKKWSESSGWVDGVENGISFKVQLVLAFGDRFILENSKRFEEIRSMYPSAHILTASSAGDILGTEIHDEKIILTAIYFEKTKIKAVGLKVKDYASFFECGEKIGLSLQSEELQHIFVISEGVHINGTNLVRGISSLLPEGIQITGGLAGDGARFEKTVVGLDEPPQEDRIAAIGFYGKNLEIGYGSVGGWESFGPRRKVTKSKGNVLYELDSQPALTLYKKYLGDKAKDLPASSLFFPLCIQLSHDQVPLVRTVLRVDEKEETMTFAGNIPEGCSAQLMQANFEKLIHGAASAATMSHEALQRKEPDLAILISCVGRRMVLGQRVEEELETIQEIIGKKPIITGFYSYGEIAPSAPKAKSELHNQTMTITTFREV